MMFRKQDAILASGEKVNHLRFTDDTVLIANNRMK